MIFQSTRRILTPWDTLRSDLSVYDMVGVELVQADRCYRQVADTSRLWPGNLLFIPQIESTGAR